MKNFKFLIFLFALAAFTTSCKEDPCEDVSCLNGGVCVEGICDCPVGYVGAKCEERVNFNILKVPSDTLVFVNDTTNVPIQVVWLEGQNKENVTLTVTNVPANFTAEVIPNTGTPDFNATLRIIGGPNAVTGTYNNLNVVGTIGSGLTVSKNFNIKVENNCRPFLLGFYQVNEACATGNYSYTSTVTADPVYPNRIEIDDFATTGNKVYIIVDCDAKTLTIPSQTFFTTTIEGSGTFNVQTESYSIAYTLKSGALTETCNAVYDKF